MAPARRLDCLSGDDVAPRLPVPRRPAFFVVAVLSAGLAERAAYSFKNSSHNRQSPLANEDVHPIHYVLRRSGLSLEEAEPFVEAILESFMARECSAAQNAANWAGFVKRSWSW